MDETEIDIVDAPKELTEIVPDEVLVEQSENPMSFTQSKQVTPRGLIYFYTYKIMTFVPLHFISG